MDNRIENHIKILSIIIPGYNEAKTIALVLEKVMAVRLPQSIQKEIVVIDDCSIDDTRDKVEIFMMISPAAI